MLQKTRAFILIILVLLSLNSLTSASDDDPLTAWQIEQRCVPEPIAPPEDWIYPGTILFSGYAGIHGVQADWETPHVVVSFNVDTNENYPLEGGQLSPDGRWYALSMGETLDASSFNQYVDIHSIGVFSTADNQVIYSIRLQDYQAFQYYVLQWNYLPIEWRNNREFAINALNIAPFDDEVSALGFLLTGSRGSDRTMSPDFTRNFDGIRVENNERLYGLVDLQNLQIITDNLEVLNLSWRRDSTGFIAQERADADEWNGLSYYDRDGNLIEHIFDLGEGRVNFERGVSGRNDLRWSPDNSQFAFVYDAPYPEPNRLYIVDWNAQIVIDTCLSQSSDVVWSPDGTMLAFLEPARENLKVVVLDTSTWHTYDVARHSGQLVHQLYSSPDMVGWRD